MNNGQFILDFRLRQVGRKQSHGKLFIFKNRDKTVEVLANTATRPVEIIALRIKGVKEIYTFWNTARHGSSISRAFRRKGLWPIAKIWREITNQGLEDQKEYSCDLNQFFTNSDILTHTGIIQEREHNTTIEICERLYTLTHKSAEMFYFPYKTFDEEKSFELNILNNNEGILFPKGKEENLILIEVPDPGFHEFTEEEKKLLFRYTVEIPDSLYPHKVEEVFKEKVRKAKALKRIWEDQFTRESWIKTKIVPNKKMELRYKRPPKSLLFGKPIDSKMEYVKGILYSRGTEIYLKEWHLVTSKEDFKIQITNGSASI